MTVCIAAICDSGKKIVVAADRMLTFPSPVSLEWETEEPKIEDVSLSCVALSSGNVAHVTEILQNVRQQAAQNPKMRLSALSELLRQAYVNCRLQKCHEQVVTPLLGFDFVRSGMPLPVYLQAQPGVYQGLLGQQQMFNLGVDIILAGVEEDTAHIAYVFHPGSRVVLDKPGYCSVGSGGIHASTYLSLRGQTGQKSLDDTIYNVYAAKCVAEVAPGVGKETDIAVVETNKVRHCEKQVLAALSKEYGEQNQRRTQNLGDIMAAYANQCESEEGKEQKA